MTSHNLTIIGLGLGTCIHMESVHGIGATIVKNLTFKDNLISLYNHSILEIFIHSSSFILICTIDGHISNHSIVIGTLNSISFSCSAFAFSIRNVSSIVVASQAFDSMRSTQNVGLSPEKCIIGLGFFFSIFSSTFFFISSFINERDISCG
ncbi:MAG: hypothetical protein WCG25_09210 [bacterium]